MVARPSALRLPEVLGRVILSSRIFLGFACRGLGEMIHEEVRVGRCPPLQVSANGTNISHLFFCR